MDPLVMWVHEEGLADLGHRDLKDFKDQRDSREKLEILDQLGTPDYQYVHVPFNARG